MSTFMLETTGSQRLLQRTYDMIRERLVHPENAVKDEPINLKFKKGFKPWPPEPEIVPPELPHDGIVLEDPPVTPPPVRDILYLDDIDGDRADRWPPNFSKHIKKVVAREFDVKVLDMESHRRTADCMIPRHVAIYLCKELTLLSLPAIGRLFGGRDHSSVWNAIKKMPVRMCADSLLAQRVAEMKLRLAMDLKQWRSRE